MLDFVRFYYFSSMVVLLLNLIDIVIDIEIIEDYKKPLNKPEKIVSYHSGKYFRQT